MKHCFSQIQEYLHGKALFSSLFCLYACLSAKIGNLDEKNKNNYCSLSLTFASLKFICGKEQNCSEFS